jgi:hypothetical protein
MADSTPTPPLQADMSTFQPLPGTDPNQPPAPAAGTVPQGVPTSVPRQGMHAAPQAAPSAPQADMNTFVPLGEEAPSQQQTAEKEGEVTNDVGNKVIVPKGHPDDFELFHPSTWINTGKDEESFSDTMKRAAEHGKTLVDTKTGNLTPEGQKEFAAEEKTMPEKTAETLGAAAGIGIAGPAALAAGGELLVNSPEIATAVVKHLLQPGTILKFPAGRALEYYLMGKLGLSSGHVAEIAKHIP